MTRVGVTGTVADQSLRTLVRGGQSPLAVPLSYPDPAGEFFGYERHGLRSFAGWDLPGTKAVVGGATLAATTLVAITTGQGIVRAGDAITAYRASIRDDWSAWLEQLYECCKRSWAHQILAGAEERRQLRELCRQALG